MPRLTVIIPTHNPDPGRLARTLAGLRAQTLPAADWETLLVDNASASPVTAPPADSPSPLRLIREPQLGLTSARRRGLREAGGEIVVLVDDDNVLAPGYLAGVLRLFAAHPQVGALGGKSVAEFAAPPPAWTAEFHALLAVRDLGDTPLLSAGLRPAGTDKNVYPRCAPIGAGMALRRAAIESWLGQSTSSSLTDRQGAELTSAGDNDIVLSVMQAGWEVGYFPELSLMHLIPASRLEPAYLGRLNRGIQKSWMQVLARHAASPWPKLSATGARLRQAKAWFVHRAWSSPAAHIRWQGACGHFEGRVNPTARPDSLP